MVFEASAIKSFTIKEDSTAIYASGKENLKCHESDAPDRVRAMSNLIEQFQLQRQEFEWMLQRQDAAERQHTRSGSPMPTVIGNEPKRLTTLDRPTFDTKGPVRQFKVTLNLQHPYWSKMQWKMDGPSFDRDDPSVEEYIEKYEKKEKKLHTMAKKLMKMMNPAAKEDWV